MGAIASLITSLTIVYSTIYSDADQRNHQSSASLAFVRGIHRGPVNSPHKMASNAENVSIWWRHHGIGGDFNIFAQILFYLFVRGTVGLFICCFCNVWKVLTNNRRHNIYSVLYNGLITFSWDLRRQKTRPNFHNKYRHFWLSERTPSSVIC